jgi:hypothetical protein
VGPHSLRPRAGARTFPPRSAPSYQPLPSRSGGGGVCAQP